MADGAGQGSAAGVVVQGDPEPRSADVEAAGVDHGPAGEQRPEQVVYVGFELGHLRTHEPAQLINVPGSVEEPKKRTKSRTVVDDRAGGGAHLEVVGVTTQQWGTGTDGRPQGHRPSVTGGRPADEPTVHTLRTIHQLCLSRRLDDGFRGVDDLLRRLLLNVVSGVDHLL